MANSFPTLSYLFSFYHRVSKLFKEVFQSLFQSVNSMILDLEYVTYFEDVQKFKH